MNNKSKALFLILAILSFLPTATLAFPTAASSGKEISVFLMITSLFGGLGMFLYGMEMMSDGMKVAAGNKMRSILEKLTSNRLLAVGVGAFVTMVIQSSSATTVMLVSFVNSGLLTFIQGLGVILGSNIGSTITAQIVAFKVTDYALALVAAGALMALFSKKDSTKNIGFVILGFGLLFYGMKVMSDTMKPLRSNPDFNNILISLENPFMGILAGAVFTALIQSSSATTGIVITLASGGSITLEAGIPLIFGANVGTCITALLAGLNASKEAKRVAIAHVTFNLTGVLLFCFWIPTFSEFISKTSSDIPRQIANAHTIFNILATVVFIPFTPLVGKLIIKYFPDEKKDRDITKPAVMHLNDDVLDTPTVAISNAQAEIRGVIGLLERVVGSVAKPFISEKSLKDIEDENEDGTGYSPFMNGNFVFKNAVVRFMEVINEALVKNNLTKEDIDLLIPHQANLRISQYIQKSLGLSDSQVYNNIMKYGNTTAASIPIPLKEALINKKLKKGISGLNQESRDRMKLAFNEVNEKFQNVFKKLFGGGHAELNFVDSDDPLEAGLEMLAQPPGKKLKSMESLSGGEKALTAISLIFGVFLTNPVSYTHLRAHET